MLILVHYSQALPSLYGLDMYTLKYAAEIILKMLSYLAAVAGEDSLGNSLLIPTFIVLSRSNDSLLLRFVCLVHYYRLVNSLALAAPRLSLSELRREGSCC